MQLSEHFSIAELSVTEVRGADNTPPTSLIPALQDTAHRMEAVRALLGHPIHVNSGYRSPRVNELVGGAVNSAHMGGRAVDFVCPAFGTPLKICHAIAAAKIHLDQLIEEGTWVHISFDPKMRGEILTKKPGGGYVTGLKP